LSFTLLIVFWLAIDLLLFRYSWRNVDCFLVPPILKFDRYQSIRTGSRNEVFGVGNLEKREHENDTMAINSDVQADLRVSSCPFCIQFQFHSHA
ncbi:hypothetical protein PRIPAC_82803, partial [Pristionchus pacificus]